MSTTDRSNSEAMRAARRWGMALLIIAAALGTVLASVMLGANTRSATPLARALAYRADPGEAAVPLSRIGIVPTADNRGMVLFGRYCDSCHPAGRQGIGSDLRSAQVKREFASVDKIAKLVRAGGFDMPPFRKELLSDGDLGAIGEYVLSIPSDRQ